MAKQLFPLKNLNGECTGTNVVIQDLTDQKQLEARLREADKRKDDFLAVLGHEWRNPLASSAMPLSCCPFQIRRKREKSGLASSGRSLA
jgi:hypothetical protein